MKIVPALDITDHEWDAFCDRSPEAWVRHRSAGRRSVLALDVRNKDYSFGIIDSDRHVAIVPLVAQPRGERERTFLFSSSMPSPAPALIDGLTDADHERILTACMAEIDRLARVHGVGRTWMAIDVFSSIGTSETAGENPLVRFGYQDASGTTSVIDLRQDDEQLLKRMSKGHRTDIVFARKQAYAVDFFDGDTITHEIWQRFIALYEAAAGRGVYPPDRWTETLERIRSGFGLLVCIRAADGDTYFSASLITIYKRCAYYSMAATDPHYRSLRGIGQLLQWRAMGELKRREFEFYDMGGQNGTTEKELNIARFKRHFGGTPTFVWAGIKTY